MVGAAAAVAAVAAGRSVVMRAKVSCKRGSPLPRAL
jgi:hypothetical protein